MAVVIVFDKTGSGVEIRQEDPGVRFFVQGDPGGFVRLFVEDGEFPNPPEFEVAFEDQVRLGFGGFLFLWWWWCRFPFGFLFNFCCEPWWEKRGLFYEIPGCVEGKGGRHDGEACKEGNFGEVLVHEKEYLILL